MKIVLILALLNLNGCIHHHTHNSGVTTANQYNNHYTGEKDPVYKSVVQIIIGESPRRATGTGFVIKNINNNSYIVTVQHLCGRRGIHAKVIPVPDNKNFREKYVGKTVYTNTKDDFCIIRAYDTGKQFLPIKISKKPPKIGEKVYTIGASVGIFPTKTDGYVIGHDLLGALGRDIEGETIKKLLSSVAVTTGNSGGPVYNGKYELVGMLQSSHKEFVHSSMSLHVNTIKKHLKKYFRNSNF